MMRIRFAPISLGVQVQDLAKEGHRAARGRGGIPIVGGGSERDAVLLAVHPDGGDQHAEAQEHLLSPVDLASPQRGFGDQGSLHYNSTSVFSLLYVVKSKSVQSYSPSNTVCFCFDSVSARPAWHQSS